MHVAVLRLLDRSSGSERERIAGYARFTMCGTTLATTDTPLPRRWTRGTCFCVARPPPNIGEH
jgi:hypothetical protein